MSDQIPPLPAPPPGLEPPPQGEITVRRGPRLPSVPLRPEPRSGDKVYEHKSLAALREVVGRNGAYKWRGSMSFEPEEATSLLALADAYDLHDLAEVVRFAILSVAGTTTAIEVATKIKMQSVVEQSIQVIRARATRVLNLLAEELAEENNYGHQPYDGASSRYQRRKP